MASYPSSSFTCRRAPPPPHHPNQLPRPLNRCRWSPGQRPHPSSSQIGVPPAGRGLANLSPRISRTEVIRCARDQRSPRARLSTGAARFFHSLTDAARSVTISCSWRYIGAARTLAAFPSPGFEGEEGFVEGRDSLLFLQPPTARLRCGGALRWAEGRPGHREANRGRRGEPRKEMAAWTSVGLVAVAVLVVGIAMPASAAVQPPAPAPSSDGENPPARTLFSLSLSPVACVFRH